MIVVRQVGIKCINNRGCEHALDLGRTYRHWRYAPTKDGGAIAPLFFVDGPDSFFMRSRFKPVYRVPAPMVRA